MPLQLLAYFRLSRIQDAAQLALISFERDTIISQNNEYEILQLMMGDCRERLAEYEGVQDRCQLCQEAAADPRAGSSC